MTLVLPPQLKPPQLHDKVLLALPPTLHQHAVKMARARHLIYVMRQNSTSSRKPNSLNFPAIFKCRDASAGVGRFRLRSFLKNRLVCTTGNCGLRNDIVSSFRFLARLLGRI